MNLTRLSPKVSHSIETALKIIYICFSVLDVTVIFNFMMALSSMTNGETWTPICIPGCTEEYMLHVYISFKQLNLGIVLVCTDHQCFEECHEFSN